MRAAREARGKSYLGYGAVPVLKKRLCHYYSGFQNIVHYGHTDILLEFSAKMVFAEMTSPRYLFYGQGRGYISVYVLYGSVDALETPRRASRSFQKYHNKAKCGGVDFRVPQLVPLLNLG